MEKTFKFTVEIAHDTYALLLRESRNREGSKGAVPSRTARQLIEEKLEEIAKPTDQTQPDANEDETDKPKQKSKKQRSTKIDVGADESTPTI